jgi:hypothetical protein
MILTLWQYASHSIGFICVAAARCTGMDILGKIALIARNGIVSCVGLDAPTASAILDPRFKSSYAIGDKIGVWPIFALTETELVAGRDNKHLDFRLSVLKVTDGEAASIVVSTICTVHNVFGKLYLFFIAPFHKWGLKRILSNAISAGRL